MMSETRPTPNSLHKDFSSLSSSVFAYLSISPTLALPIGKNAKKWVNNWQMMPMTNSKKQSANFGYMTSSLPFGALFNQYFSII